MLSRVSASQTHALVIPPTDFASDREVCTAKWLAERGRQFILRFSETGIEALADMLNIPPKQRPNASAWCPALHRTSLTRTCLLLGIMHACADTPAKDNDSEKNRQGDCEVAHIWPFGEGTIL